MFQVSHIDRVYLLRAETKNERITWVRKLTKASEQYIETEMLQRQKAHRARSFRADNVGKLVVLIIEGSDLKASDPNGGYTLLCFFLLKIIGKEVFSVLYVCRFEYS